MKKSDLQLGDWCRIKGGEPFQITATTLSLADDVFAANVEPIPVTSDILIKLGFIEDNEYWNGFYKYTFEKTIKDDVKIPDSSITFDAKIKISIIYRVGDRLFEKFELDVYNKFGYMKISDYTKYTDLGGEPLYIHDLQHIFKIANIEDNLEIAFNNN